MLQLIINKYLSLDPDLEYKLEPLNGKIISINCTDYTFWQICGVFTHQHLLLISSKPEHIDVTIRSTLAGFIQFILSKDKSAIMIDGNVHIAELILKFISNLDLDWEEELSKYSGDVLAYQAVTLMKRFKKYHAHSSSSLEAMISEYLQEESGLLPTNLEVNDFINAVDDLRMHVDRVQAQVTAHENN
mgnify:CR=1 FL=1